jgi:glycosyltransferase involved in cell wall biosynthesis
MHYGGFGGGELVQLAAQLAGARAVVRTEHVPPVPPITRKGRMLVHLRDRFLARVICVSEQNRQEHLSSLGRDAEQVMVVHNGVDLERFSPSVPGTGVAREFGFAEDAPIVGTIARLVEHRKGLNYFLDMAAQVHRARPDVRFLLVGEGDLRPELEAQAAQLGLHDVLVFTGARADVPRLYAALNVFVMPSLYEGCQYSLLEAMAMARPIVSTAAGIAPVVIRDHETGIMVPYADAPALAAGVVELLGDPALAKRLGQAGREVIVDHFSLDAMIEQLISVYRQAAQ